MKRRPRRDTRKFADVRGVAAHVANPASRLRQALATRTIAFPDVARKDGGR